MFICFPPPLPAAGFGQRGNFMKSSLTFPCEVVEHLLFAFLLLFLFCIVFCNWMTKDGGMQEAGSAVGFTVHQLASSGCKSS